MAGGAVEVPRGRMVIASNPVATGPDLTQMGLAQPKPTATARVRPGEDVAALSRRTGVQASEIRRLNNIEPSGRLTTGQRLIIPQSGVFSVAMDGAQIAFDVPPRIDRGVALAPFRSLFEYAGGVLYWYNPTKRVHAVSSTREVELQIGSSMALVNNRRLGMDRQALLDHGRTIVPMSFVSEVLDVVMSYDNHSGRLLLQSKR